MLLTGSHWSWRFGRDTGQLVLALIPVAAALSQTSQIPYAPGSDGPGPTFTSETVRRSYPGSYSSIHKVDFRNFTFPLTDQPGIPAGSLVLKNGHYQGTPSLKGDGPSYLSGRTDDRAMSSVRPGTQPALDHRHCSLAATKPALSGLFSTYLARYSSSSAVRIQ